jgi:Flp pilus assembly pilin Flp
MQRMLNSMWQEDDGVLSFEWTMLAVIVVFGIVGGLAGARDAILDELGDTAEAYLSIDQSFSLAAFGPFPAVVFVDTPHTFVDCDRGGPVGPPNPDDVDS